MSALAILIPCLLLSTSENLEGPDVIYGLASPAVVGIDCWSGPSRSGDPFAFGTGVIIDPEGMVLTSVTVVPAEARRIRVYLQEGRTLEAERVRSVPQIELVLLKLEAPAGGDKAERRGNLPFLRLGDSGGLRVGQLAYTLGNAFRSISEDNQVSLAAGAISGRYALREARSGSRYIGPAIETTAAVNDGMDGGPLVNSRGEMVGLVSLNFSRNRWLGTAIPINTLKPYLADDLGLFSDRLEVFRAFLGLELEPAALAGPRAGRLGDGLAAGDWRLAADAERTPVVIRVDRESPAQLAGIEVGDRVKSWGGAAISDGREFRKLFKLARPGDRLKLGLDGRRGPREVELVLWGKY
jgi:serine protease Do